jgi:hypothetical protein
MPYIKQMRRRTMPFAEKERLLVDGAVGYDAIKAPGY